MLDAPEYPQDIVWMLCDDNYPCITLENTKLLAKYLAEVKRYQTHVEDVCK